MDCSAFNKIQVLLKNIFPIPIGKNQEKLLEGNDLQTSFAFLKPIGAGNAIGVAEAYRKIQVCLMFL